MDSNKDKIPIALNSKIGKIFSLIRLIPIENPAMQESIDNEKIRRNACIMPITY